MNFWIKKGYKGCAIVSILLLFFCSCQPTDINEKIRVINEGWSFKKQSDTLWFKATVPGTIHTDLLANNIIEDPFFRLNELNLQWIDKCNWEYKTSFSVSKEELNFINAQLVFNGLDTYADVYLNDSLILQADNMFLRYKLDCRALLKEGDNALRIVFYSPILKGIQKYDATNYKLPISANDLAEIGEVENGKRVSAFIRKAPYHFGWDWGPRLVTSGIWRKVELQFWNGLKIENSFIEQQEINQSVKFKASASINSNEDKEVYIQVRVEDSLVTQKKAKLKKGSQNISIPFEILNPRLWWPNGMGEQFLYDVKLSIQANGYSVQTAHQIGLRNVQLIQQPDSTGTSFYFKINGVPTFAKGVNYIPQDVFLPRVSKEHYRHILQSAKDANMNMIRVWGGGIYECDYFYELCDSLGLMVWQDFMFACSMYPKDEDIVSSIYDEAIDNISRLRNHPCIVLWCGNNEVLSAWKRWGWEEQVKKEQSEEIANLLWSAYDTIFHHVLPSAVKKSAPKSLYWSASPSSSKGVKSSNNSGDMHYWGVWWGGEPFTAYEKEVPRFMSEYGFQSFPSFSTIEQFTVPEDYNVYSKVMQSHQRSSIGNKTIEEYLLKEFNPPKDFKSFVYVSQLLQAKGIKIGAHAHRRNREKCMGSLYWQLNDCWPVASWSSIDYYGKWKPLHYQIKKAFSNCILSFQKKQDSLAIYIVSDSLKELFGELRICSFDFSGKKIFEKVKQVEVKSNSSTQVLIVCLKDFFPLQFNNVFLKAEFIVGENTISSEPFYAVKTKDLLLQPPKYNLTFEKKKTKEFLLTLQSNTLAKNVFISTSMNCSFNDNAFDLCPGEIKKIAIKTEKDQPLKKVKNNIKIISLVDTY